MSTTAEIDMSREALIEQIRQLRARLMALESGIGAPGDAEMRLSAILRHVPAYIYVIDPQNRYLHVNQKYEELVHCSSEQLIGRSLMQVFGERIGGALAEHNQQVLREKRTIEFEEVAVIDGETRYYASIKSVLFRSDGSASGILGISTDITERKKAEEALRISDERYRMVYQATNDVIWDWDLATDHLNWNDAVREHLGFEPHEMGPTILGWYDRIHPEDVDRVVTGIHSAIDGGRDSWSDEYRFAKRDGTYAVFLDRGYIARDKSGHPFRMIGSMLDLTERRMAEARLKESENRFRDLADNIAQLAWMADHTGHVFWFNQRWLDYTGGAYDTMQGWGWHTAVHPEHVERVITHFRQHVEGGRACEDTFPLRGHDGEYRWFLTRAVPIRDAHGHVTRWFGTNTDVTEQRLAQEALQKAKHAAEMASGAKDHFLAVLSHELRTPLSPALIASAIAEKDPELPEHLRDCISTVRRNVELEARLIDDLLDLTRITRGKLTLHQQVIDVCEVVRHAVAICHAEAADKGILLEQSVPEDPIRVFGDSARLQQVFWNLFKNAVKFTPSGGQISIIVTKDAQEWVHVEVADTGVGIGKDLLPRIFDAFEQGGLRVTRQFGGLGLGLAISKGLVELHDGLIHAHSDGLGQGARFIVELPPAAGEAEPRPQGDDSATSSCPAGVCRILLVEDHEATARITARLLRSLGHTVLMAGSIEQAIQVFRAEPFDLLISDLGLPDGSGHDLLRYLLTQRPIRAIALSGYGMDQDIRASTAAGFIEHLTKPVNPTQLEDAITRVMGNAMSD